MSRSSVSATDLVRGWSLPLLVALALLLSVGLVAPGAAQSPPATPGATPATPAGSPVAVQRVAITGAVRNPLELTADDLRRMPVTSAGVTFEAHGRAEQHTFTGTPLLGVIASAGLTAPADARNPLISDWIVVTGSDGYQVVLAGAELDPNFANTPVLLAWEQDGKAMTGDNGPARLVVPGDVRGGRYVSGVVKIEVFSLATS